MSMIRGNMFLFSLCLPTYILYSAVLLGIYYSFSKYSLSSYYMTVFWGVGYRHGPYKGIGLKSIHFSGHRQLTSD